MSMFRNILAGIAIPQQPGAPPALDAIAQSTVRNALWAARASGARLAFFSAVPQAGAEENTARHLLAGLVEQAREQSIEADTLTAVGQGWVELTRQVIRNGHDLLVIGTHDSHGLKRLFRGSLAQTLLHECPCPVWVCRPGPDRIPRNILVASDLSPLSDRAVRVGLAMAQFAGAPLHLLDVVENRLDRLYAPYPADPISREYHARIRDLTDHALQAQASRSAAAVAADVGVQMPPLRVHVADSDGIIDHAIVQFVQDHHIDLLVLGTAARHGLSSVVQPNLAEILLPEVACSVLAVKPAEFHSSVSLAG